MVRVLTVDDQPLFRDAARAVITATPGFEALAEVGSGEDAIDLLDRLQPELVLVDISLPGIDGLETARQLTEHEPAPLVILISADDDPPCATRRPSTAPRDSSPRRSCAPAS
jgi:DNA-binding NarL/FixJ family response regulator